MRHVRTFLLLLLTATALQAKLTVPPIVYKTRTLPNGLQVYSVQDHASPTVAIHVWYRVGSKDDPQGRSGFAHLFEHMMFKSTKNMPSEMLDRLTEDVGGFNNAMTFDDSTPYYEVVPSNYLQTLLWAEAERMGSLKVDDATFKSEREVVKEEFRFRILAPPYGRFFYNIDRHSFVAHPYRRPGIGSIEDLDAATIEDVRQFHSTFYRPDNAVLIVTGDFDQKQLDGWIDKYFGPIPRPSTPVPRVTVKEPPRTASRTADVKAANVPLPAMAITWLAPPASSSDSAALNVAAAILAKGESSRLYQALVYESQVAQQIDAGADLREDLGLFYVLAIISSDRTLKEGQQALERELKSLQEKAVPASELEKAKNLLLTEELRERETNNGKAFSLGQSIVLEKNAAEVNRGLERLLAVTAADVQRVMKKYVGEGKPVIINYSAEQAPSEKKEGGQ